MSRHDASTATRVPALDGLRGLAILLVLIWHFYCCSLDQSQDPTLLGIRRWLGLSFSGVDLFFVLSGYLLGGILLDEKASPHFFRTFYIRRACRILPLYLLWLLIATGVLFSGLNQRYLGFAIPFADSIPLWSYWTFTQNFPMAVQGVFGGDWLSSTWSLAIEEQFYLLLPLLIRYVPPRTLPVLFLNLICLAPLSRVLSPSSHVAYVLPPCRLDCLMLGALAAWSLRQPGVEAWLREQRTALLSLAALLFAGLVAFSWKLILPGSLTLGTLGLTWIALLYVLILVLCVTKPEGALAQAFSFAPLRWLGLISYAIYLFHQGVNSLLHAWFLGVRASIHTWPGAQLTMLAAAVTVLLATVSYHLYEAPFRRLGHRYRY